MRLLPLLLLSSALPLLSDDEADFSITPDASWQRYDPRALAGLIPAADFDFSGNQCRIVAPQPLTEAEYYTAKGLARAGFFAPTDFSEAVASVDITSWSTTSSRSVDGTFIGVFTRVALSLDTIGDLNGYSASIIDMGEGSGPGGIGRNGRLQLMLIYQETTYVPLVGYVDFPLDATHDYRLVLVSRGDIHTARVFDLASPAAPLAELVGQDENFTTGKTGIMILTDRIPHAGGHFFIEATFDNFLAWDGTPPPMTIQSGGDPGTIELSCDTRRSMATDLQRAPTLNPEDWQPATPAATSQSGDRLITTFPIDGPRCFFRRKSL